MGQVKHRGRLAHAKAGRALRLQATVALICFALLAFAGCENPGGGGPAGVGSEYPSQDVEFIVPYSPGGGYDSWARALAPFIEEHLPNDVSVVVRNVPGAGGQIATGQLYSAKPDGSQIQIMDTLALAGQQLSGEANFDLSKFVYLGTVTVEPWIFLAAGDSDIDTIEDLRERAPVPQAVTGFTSSDGAITVALYRTLGIEYNAILHEGNTEARLSVIRGDAAAVASPPESALGEMESGDLKPILFIGEELEEGAPGYEETRETQTAEELGHTELNNLASSRMIAAPPGLPDGIKQVLDQAIQDALNDPEFLKQAEENQLTPRPLNAEETAGLANTTLDTLSEYEDALREAVENDPNAR